MTPQIPRIKFLGQIFFFLPTGQLCREKADLDGMSPKAHVQYSVTEHARSGCAHYRVHNAPIVPVAACALVPTMRAVVRRSHAHELALSIVIKGSLSR